MRLHLPIRSPDKAYIDRLLWLPKQGVRWQAITGSLEFLDVDDARKPYMVKLWEDSPHHVGVPREFLKVSDYPNYPFPFIELTPRDFPRSGISTSISLRDERQHLAYQAVQQNPNGVLNLGCGRGKTVLALKRIADLGCPGLIVVHNSYLFNQWKERINQHLVLPPGEEVGIIQGPTFDWQRPVAIAMIHTLARRVLDGRLPPEFVRHFGIAIYDEVHHLAAKLFSQTAHVLTGYRLGLTATPKRLDGLEYIYNYHLGPVFFMDTEQDLIPRMYFQLTPSKLDMNSDQVKDVKGEVHIGKLRSALATNPDIVQFRYRCIKEAADQGRKILAVSHAKNLIIELHKMFPGSALIIEETPKEERERMVKTSRITFAIARLGVEGLDDPMLDTIFFLTSFSSENDLEQSLGRIGSRDPNAVKSHPVAVIFDDVYIDRFRSMCKKLRAKLNEWGYPYQTIPAPTF